MYITNLDEVVPAMRVRLRDYLVKTIGIEPDAKKFKCIVHDDNDPSMYFNPKNAEETAHCFSCNATIDIFEAASRLESLPPSGPDWIKETIPHLAEKLEIPIKLGDPSPIDRERAKQYKIAQDISDILSQSNANEDYLKSRNWENDTLSIGSISEEELVTALAEKGWELVDINTSLLVRSTRHHFFGEDKLTFSIKDYRGRPVAFISRSLGEASQKYINTPESCIYEKGKILFGLDVALRKGKAKNRGIYIVEGPGDVAQLNRLGVYNVAAVCGTAFTADHLSLLGMLGIRTMYLSLDWDKAGWAATNRILKEEIRFAPGISIWVVDPPKDENGNATHDDVDSLLHSETTPDKFKKLDLVPAFEWVLRNFSDHTPADEICSELIPIVASENSAVKRELLIQTLCEYTDMSFQSISEDVRSIRDGKAEERRERIVAATEKYQRAVSDDPLNVRAIAAEHERDLEYIEKEYETDVIGVNYQLNRFDALQEKRRTDSDKNKFTEFKMGWFTDFGEALSSGMPWTEGALIYVGGRANSGKTATVLMIGLDVAMHDPDAIVVMHTTDDTYSQIEPRLKTNIARMMNPGRRRSIKIGETAAPYDNITSNEVWGMYNTADEKFRELLSEEKLVIVDMEDGSTLSALEKNLRYLRRRYPNKKMLVVCDNTHNYIDFPNFDQRMRMTKISTAQKNLTGRYRCCMIATAEYRKNMPMDKSKLVFPVDDDLADARALTYRPNMIIHVYNDLHDRKDEAEIFWTDPADPEKPKPRLMLLITKNKLTKFKDKLILDLDTDTVTLKQFDKAKARLEWMDFSNAKKNGDITFSVDRVISKEALDFLRMDEEDQKVDVDAYNF
jgi:DNA primase catalytic core